MLKAALVQMSVESGKEKNLDKAEALVREAAANGAKLICLQELFTTIYFPFEIDPRHFELAEPIPGPSIDRMREVAREEEVVLVAPIFERTLEGQFFNSAPVIGTEGQLLGVYRKSSIPFVKVASAVGIEKYYFTPGDSGLMVFDTPFGARFGILVCYDRHFPEAARVLALRGAQIILVPTATHGMTRDIWELELRAHAAFNICFVGGVNRVGVDQGGSDKHHYGQSLWVGPGGQVMSVASDSEDEILYAEMDLSDIGRIRADWGFYRDRRPDLYSDVTLHHAGRSAAGVGLDAGEPVSELAASGH